MLPASRAVGPKRTHMLIIVVVDFDPYYPIPSLPFRLSARSAAWTWSPLVGMQQQQRRREGRGEGVGFGVLRPLGAEATATPAGDGDEAAKASQLQCVASKVN